MDANRTPNAPASNPDTAFQTYRETLQILRTLQLILDGVTVQGKDAAALVACRRWVDRFIEGLPAEVTESEGNR